MGYCGRRRCLSEQQSYQYALSGENWLGNTKLLNSIIEYCRMMWKMCIKCPCWPYKMIGSRTKTGEANNWTQYHNGSEPFGKQSLLHRSSPSILRTIFMHEKNLGNLWKPLPFWEFSRPVSGFVVSDAFLVCWFEGTCKDLWNCKFYFSIRRFSFIVAGWKTWRILFSLKHKVTRRSVPSRLSSRCATFDTQPVISSYRIR